MHRLLKNAVPIREYVLMTEDLYGTGSVALPATVGEVETDLEGFGAVRSYYVGVADLRPGEPPLPAPGWRGRLGRTVHAAGAGLPYVLGRTGRRPVASAR
ncbi:hypothetical protein L2K70_16045 [Nocardioides KLBMP 9356]|uniref:Uncharacterized protein n=1 Tax=Nocardioides potassii TaxID=2911371 RepID=A0ABS9HD64_9ACTN|nr:hypothetical protein [Nocardioides potassii]MCF6379127.1 hypothetical protein [Nocardioides potassii]